MVDWRFDMENAPRGSRIKAGKASRFQPDYLQLSIIDKGRLKFIFSYRTEGTRQTPDGYWAGCAVDQIVYAWAPAPLPADVPEEYADRVSPAVTDEAEEDLW